MSSFEWLGVIFIKVALSLWPRTSSLAVPLAPCSSMLSISGQPLLDDKSFTVIQGVMIIVQVFPELYCLASFLFTSLTAQSNCLIPQTSSSFSTALSGTLSVNRKHRRFCKILQKTSQVPGEAYNQGCVAPGRRGGRTCVVYFQSSGIPLSF